MNTRIRITPFVVVLALALGVLALAPSTALAQKPVKFEFPWLIDQILPPNEVGCGFAIHVRSVWQISEIDHYDESGTLIRLTYHAVVQDTYDANGKSLVGMPFAINASILFESDGVTPQFNYQSGIMEKIRLPNGSLFIGAGRVEWTSKGDIVWILSPDHGNPGNVAAFCAALAAN